MFHSGNHRVSLSDLASDPPKFPLQEGRTTIFSHSFLFGWDDHERRSPARPPHQDLCVIGVGSAQRIRRDGFLIVEYVRLLLIGRPRQGGSRAQRHVWVHCDVHPHPPAHRLQHDTLLEERRERPHVSLEASWHICREWTN